LAAAASGAPSAAASPLISSNLMPTHQVDDPLIAANLTATFSATPPNDRPTSKVSSVTIRSQN
jgi:hypothetical protein